MRERSSGTISSEEIECKLQSLDRGELGRRDGELIGARAKAGEDLKGNKENGISDLGTPTSGRFGLFLICFGEDVGTIKEIRTTGSQF
jgi:hypothetical protein